MIGNDLPTISRFKHHLSTCFHMKDLGFLKYFLVIEVTHNVSGLYLNQRKYVLDVITEASLFRSKHAVTPIEQNHHLATASGLFLSIFNQYRQLVGRF